MKELLEKFLSSELLSDENKTELVEAITSEIESARTAAIEEGRVQGLAEAKTEFAAQYMVDKEALVEALDTKVTELLKAEIDELKEDIERFRDLEAEKAAEIAEAKALMAEQVKKDMAELVETLDTFLELRLTEEINELKESIEEVKKIETGRKIYEAFKEEIKADFLKESDLGKQLDEMKRELEAKNAALNEAKRTLNSQLRESKMAEVLSPLNGFSRDLMETLLKTIPTDKLDEAYGNYIGRVLHEASTKNTAPSKEKESVASPVLAEGKAEPVIETKLVKGDSEVVVTESAVSPEVLRKKEQLRRAAGITGA